MSKGIGIDRQKLIAELSKAPDMILDTAYRYAVNLIKHDEDVTQKWLTSIGKESALRIAYDRGYKEGFSDAMLRADAKWTKTSDHPPDEYQDVLVTTEDGYMDTGYYYGGNSWSIGEGFYYESSEILAWQPLPLPYKAGDEE